MASNHFSGNIPLSIANASKLHTIEFGGNNFIGKLPSFGRLKNLVRLFLDENHLGTEGEDDMSILIDSLTNCTLLHKLDISRNHISGTLSISVSNLSNRVSVFSIARNRIHGVIPLGFGSLANLELLYMQGNQFEGEIPHDIGNLQKLYSLFLNGNNLRGPIPSSLGNMSFLSILTLNDNELQGTIPSSMGNFKNLLVLDLDTNNLSGTIPKELFDAAPLSIYLDLASNHLEGPIPPEIGKLKNLGVFSVAGNKMFGEIPPEIGSCSSIEKLFLNDNQFTGSIPPELKYLTALQRLNLSKNNLSGMIPTFLEKLPLDYLDLSFNDFEGDVPMLGVFANASDTFINCNYRLCGGISDLRLPKCVITKSKRRKFSVFHVSLVAIGFSIMGTIILILIWWRKKKRKGRSSPSPLKESFLNVSYGDLVKATDGFSSANIIGIGSFGTVYKGILDQDETMVAVKVLNLECYGASKSFDAECKVLRNIRHRNLLRIITTCSSIDSKGNDFKALVYEYMPNGSLERWLHSSDQETLNLNQRINIAKDIGYALDYLHSQSGHAIIHCDLKPSNVLLDADMVAHVGDFGLARFAILEPSNEIQSQSIELKGTIGYAAPGKQYGLGNEASTSGDIYSYGILLLELITGKCPTESMFSGSLNIHNYVNASLPDNVIEIVDLNASLAKSSTECRPKCYSRVPCFGTENWSFMFDRISAR